jgi:hypothetical protein
VEREPVVQGPVAARGVGLRPSGTKRQGGGRGSSDLSHGGDGDHHGTMNEQEQREQGVCAPRMEKT